MSCRSISLVICMFMAVSLATLHSDPDSTEEWSTEESVREVGQQSAGEELGELLDAGDDAVVDLEAGDTKLVAHRALLAARSAVLADTLFHYIEHDYRGSLIFREMEGQTLRHLVAYLYTLRAPQLPPGEASQLMAAANEYGLPALQEECEHQLAAQLSVETAAAAAVLAVKLSANHLRDAAVNFIKDHRIKVLATKGWADALQNHPKEAAVVSRLLADRLADICGRATMEIQNITTEQAETTVTTQPLTEPSATPVTAAPALASCPTSPLDEDAVSRLRNLTKEERDHRLIQAAKNGTVGDLRELLAAGADVGAREGTFYTALHFAAMKGRVDAASCLLEAGADVESKGRWRWTPLHEAAFWDQAAMVRLLLAASADPNARDEYGSTPLHAAAWFGKPEAAAALLEGGADREVVNYVGNTPLDDARHRDHQQLIDILTRAQPVGPATMEGQSTTTMQAETTVTTQPLTEPSATSVTAAPALASCPTSPLDEDAVSRLRELSKEDRDHRLLQAAKEGAVGELRNLLAAGADVGAREGTFYTALHFAAMKRHVEAASCLLDAGADVESKGRWQWTPLHEAAFWDQAAMVRLLLVASADPNARDQYGSTPLHAAAWFGKPEAAAALLEGGADREIVNYSGNTPQDDARDRDHQQLIEILTRGQPVGPATMEGQSTTTEQAETTVITQPLTEPSATSDTAAPALASCPTSPLDEDAVSRLRDLSKEERDHRLIQAAKQGAVRDLRELLAAGADVGAREGTFYTALHFTAMKGHVEAASCLLEAGADVESKGRWWWTPLHEAAFWDQAAMVRLLLAASADPNARDEYGTTPLHVAAWFGKPGAAAALLEGGADREIENDSGSTALDDARDRDHQQLIEILTRTQPVGPATMEGQSTTTEQAETTVITQPLTEPSATSDTAAPALASCPTSPLDEDAVSRLRDLSKEERDYRLIQAAKEGAVGELRELLAAGADVRAKQWSLFTALHFAVKKGDVEAASCLLQAGAEVDSKGIRQWTPLHEAAWLDHAAMVRLLVAASADPNPRFDMGSTPLHLAARFGKAEAAVALLEAGADKEAKNDAGQTPLEVARIKGQQKLIEILTQR